MADSLVIIPTLNERENIEPLLRAVLALPGFDVLVVDDLSADGTAEVVAALQAAPAFRARLFLERRAGPRGLGFAYLHGFRWALAREYGAVFGMDADFSHAPADLPRLRAALDAGADVAIGSRYVDGGGVRNWSLNRRALSRGASHYAAAILGWRVRDATAGFVGYRRRVLETIDLANVRFVGYAFLIEMKYLAWRRGFRLDEIPIVFVERVAGRSKMSLRICREALFGVWTLKYRA